MQLTLDTYSHLVPDLKLKERAAARLDALLTEPDQNSGQNAANVVSRILTSWNQMASWLSQLQGLQGAA